MRSNPPLRPSPLHLSEDLPGDLFTGSSCRPTGAAAPGSGNIGRVTLRYSKRAKYHSITIKPLEGVVVTIPKGGTEESGFSFLREKEEWVIKNVERSRRVADDFMRTIKRPFTVDEETARRILTKRVEVLAGRYSFKVDTVRVRDYKSMWGSCRVTTCRVTKGRKTKGQLTKNRREKGFSLSINSRLIHLPDRLIDYVILHELVHTRIGGHGVDFWRELKRLCPKARELDRELNRLHIELLQG